MTEQEKIEATPVSIEDAFLEAQKSFRKPQKSGKNDHFKNEYSTLEDDMDAVKEALHDAGISYDFEMETGDFGTVVKTILRHPSSNQKREVTVPLYMGRQDMQSLKSATTYARRIGIEMITGIAPSDDDDAETERQGNNFGAAIQDAWQQNVLDGLQENASPLDRATAFADAIIVNFGSKNGTKALENELSRRKQIIDGLEQRFPALHSKVIEAFEARVIEIESIKHEMDVS